MTGVQKCALPIYIDGIGIEPDVELEFDMDAYEQDETADNQLDKAIEMLKK